MLKDVCHRIIYINLNAWESLQFIIKYNINGLLCYCYKLQ